jgi:hypothetical protein
MSISKQQSLSAVVMPLVRVMNEAVLSWSEREQLATAIQAAYRQWSGMEKERQAQQQMQWQQAGAQSGVGQQGAAAQGFPNNPKY